MHYILLLRSETNLCNIDRAAKRFFIERPQQGAPHTADDLGAFGVLNLYYRSL